MMTVSDYDNFIFIFYFFFHSFYLYAPNLIIYLVELLFNFYANSLLSSSLKYIRSNIISVYSIYFLFMYHDSRRQKCVRRIYLFASH